MTRANRPDRHRMLQAQGLEADLGDVDRVNLRREYAQTRSDDAWLKATRGMFTYLCLHLVCLFEPPDLLSRLVVLAWAAAIHQAVYLPFTLRQILAVVVTSGLL